MDDKVEMRVVDRVVRAVGLYSFRHPLWEDAVSGDGCDVHAVEFRHEVFQQVGKDHAMGEQLLEKGVGLGFGYCH